MKHVATLQVMLPLAACVALKVKSRCSLIRTLFSWLKLLIYEITHYILFHRIIMNCIGRQHMCTILVGLGCMLIMVLKAKQKLWFGGYSHKRVNNTGATKKNITPVVYSEVVLKVRDFRYPGG